ncbi:MAG: LysM peptidoglycan-binding domain-containing protein [Candidatus Nealsonbacteria bacterium]|nr:LysM peptidoglycan-binding domain-containing protein [Candidatus Nealsonbacteria bacterium]
MSSLKPLLVLGGLAAVVYGAYTWVNRKPDATANLDEAPFYSGGAEPLGQGAQNLAAGAAETGSTNAQPIGLTAQSGNPSAIGNPAPLGGSHAPYGAMPATGQTAAGGDRDGSIAAASHVRPAPFTGVPGTGAPGAAAEEFADSLQAVREKLQENRLGDAHQKLTQLYINPNLSEPQAKQVTDMLDQLAGEVIYSREHHLEKPYVVRSGDTLPQIARGCQVPWLLLARINGIRDPLRLEPGKELKVVRGPFHARISLSDQELTLVLKNCYAGRFPIRVDPKRTNMEGLYVVRSLHPNLQDARIDPVTIDHTVAPDPRQEHWIGLSRELSQQSEIYLHGTTGPSQVSGGVYGAIGLSDRDMDDLGAILSIGSRVKILR